MKKIIKQGLTFDDVLLIPQKTSLASRKEVDLTTQLTPTISLAIPLISSNMDTVTESAMAIVMARMGGIGMIHRFLTIEKQVKEIQKVKKEGLLVGAAIGIKDGYLERAEALVNNQVDVIVIDIAHGHSTYLIKVLKELKKKYNKLPIIAGNITTAAAARELIENGADALKVGVGPGSLCTTRIVTGSGVPQITAIMDVVEVAHEKKIPVIADGGIRTSGDVVKALAAGASTVMLGSLFAGCEESPAQTIYRGSKKFKITRGMASLKANRDRQIKDPNVKKDLKEYAAEGVEAIVPYRGAVAGVVTQFIWGIRSGFSYSGAKTLQELWERAEFIQITSSSLIESHPHDVDVVDTVVKYIKKK